MNNWFMIQPLNQIPLEPVRGWDPLSSPEPTHKETTSLLSQEARKSELRLVPYVSNYLLGLILKWKV